MTSMEQPKKTITLGYGPFALIILIVLIIGLVSGSIFGGFVLYAVTSRAASTAVQPPTSGRPWLGITYVPITARSARLYDLAADKGALIVAVAPHSPAAKAGLQEYDIITAIDQRPLDEATSLMDVILARKPGERVQLTILRGGSQRVMDVILGQLPVSSTAPANQNPLERLRQTITRIFHLR